MNVIAHIAYLAPEIPALSATFVYNEIEELVKLGFDVLPISVHRPGQPAEGKTAQRLKQRSVYLYSRSKIGILKTHLRFAFRHSGLYLKWFGVSARDALRVGLLKRAGFGLLYRFVMAVECAQILRDAACRHVHAHFAHIPTDIAMYAAGLAGISFSFTAHANDIFQRGWLLREKVERSSFAVCISEFNRQYFMSRGANAGKLFVIHCGVDMKPSEKGRAGTPGHPPKIGTLCRLVEKKGMDVLIRAIGLLAKAGHPVQVVIAGDGPLKTALEALAARLSLSALIRFIGNLPHDQVRPWLETLDLFVLPCKKDAQNDQDGVPVVLMEAMAAGVNVVSTRLSGIPELIRDGQNGLLADPGDPHSLAQAIGKILADRAAARQMKERAMQTVAADFNLGINARRLSGLIKESL